MPKLYILSYVQILPMMDTEPTLTAKWEIEVIQLFLAVLNISYVSMHRSLQIIILFVLLPSIFFIIFTE